MVILLGITLCISLFFRNVTDDGFVTSFYRVLWRYSLAYNALHKFIFGNTKETYLSELNSSMERSDKKPCCKIIIEENSPLFTYTKLRAFRRLISGPQNLNLGPETKLKYLSGLYKKKKT